jgi:hypothetical protein
MQTAPDSLNREPLRWNGDDRSVAISAAAAAVAVAAASTAAAVTTATAAATTAVTTTAATAAAFFARAGFVDGQGAAAELLAVEGVDGCFGFAVGAHFDESKAFAAAGFAIVHHLRRHDRSMLAEQLLELIVIDTVSQIPDVQTLTHGGHLA